MFRIAWRGEIFEERTTVVLFFFSYTLTKFRAQLKSVEICGNNKVTGRTGIKTFLLVKKFPSSSLIPKQEDNTCLLSW